MNRRTALQNLLATGAGSILPQLVGRNLPIPQPAPENDPKNDEDKNIIRSETRLVLLDVSVKDSKGGFAAGLSKENFSILENGKPQIVTVFDRDDAPVTVGIVVDESLSMTPKRSQVLKAAEILIEESNRLDEIFVVNFNDKVTLGLPANQPFSDDIGQLRAALQRGVPAGKTAVYDAIVDGVNHLQLGTRDKKTLVLISDGGDNNSRHTRREMLDMVERSTATIYGVGLFETDDPERDPGLLRQLAKASGGEAYFPDSAAEMEPVCRRIAKEIRSRYTVGFRPQPDPRGNGVGSQRHLLVKVTAPDHGKLIAHTRRSYFYDAAEIEKGK